jgi:hypothetical protein
MELALDIDPVEIPQTGIEPHSDLFTGVPVLNPLARLLSYSYPVHRIGTDYQPAEPGPDPTRLVMVRARDHSIGFLEVNPPVARLFEYLAGNTHNTGQELLARLQAEFPAIPAGAFEAGGRAALAELTARDIVLGTRAAGN